MLVAAATGEVMPSAKGNQAVEEMAEMAPADLRLDAVRELHNRVHGKVKDEVDVTSSAREIKEIRISVIEAPKAGVGVIDVTPVKALRDAE